MKQIKALTILTLCAAFAVVFTTAGCKNMTDAPNTATLSFTVQAPASTTETAAAQTAARNATPYCSASSYEYYYTVTNTVTKDVIINETALSLTFDGSTNTTSGTFTATELPYGTYTVTVNGYATVGTNADTKTTEKQLVLTGTSSAITLNGINTTGTAAVTLAQITNGTTNGTVSVNIMVQSFSELSASTCNLVFTSLSDSTAYTFSSAGGTNTTTTFYSQFNSPFTTPSDYSNGYTYYVTNTALSLPSGTYTASFFIGSSTTNLIDGQDTTVVVAANLTTTVPMYICIAEGFTKTFYVNSGSTGTTPDGTLSNPYTSLSAAFTAANSSGATDAKPAAIVLLADYTTSTNDTTALSNEVPVYLNLFDHTVTNTAAATTTYTALFAPKATLYIAKGTIKNDSSSSNNSVPELINATANVMLDGVTVDASNNGTTAAIETTANLFLIQSCVSSTATTASTTDYVKLGASSMLYLSGEKATIAGYTYLENGATITALSALAKEETIATLHLATAPTESAPVTVFSSTTNIDTTYWKLSNPSQAFNEKTVVLATLGFMYSNNYSNYTVTAGNFTSANVFTARKTYASCSAFDTTYDGNNNPYTLLYSDSKFILLTPEGTEVPVTTTPEINSVISVCITYDSTNGQFIAFSHYYNSTVTECYSYYLIPKPASTDTSVEMTELTNITYSDLTAQYYPPSKLLYYTDSTSSYLYLVYSSTNLVRVPVTDITSSTLKLDTASKVTGTIPLTIDGSSLTSTINDLAVMGSSLYALCSYTSSSISAVTGIYSVGALVNIPPSFTAGAITPTSTIGLTTDVSSGNYFPSSSTSGSAFYGPRRILAVGPSKFIIADDGFEVTATDATSKTVSLNKIRRTMVFNGTALSAGTSVSDYTFENTSYSGSDIIVTQTTNGVAD